MTITDIYRLLFGREGTNKGTDIDMSEHGRAGGLTTGQPFKFTKDVEETVAVDAVSSSVTYIGVAKIGTATSSATWQISKVNVSGTVTSLTYADGNDNYDNIWDNRASLSYS